MIFPAFIFKIISTKRAFLMRIKVVNEANNVFFFFIEIYSSRQYFMDGFLILSGDVINVYGDVPGKSRNWFVSAS